MMPSFTYVYSDPANWRAPPAPGGWHDTIRREMPLYNPLFTPTYGMGRIAECFRSWPGTHRSGHPQASLTAWGKHARYVLYTPFPCSLISPPFTHRFCGRSS
jgi:aminoglycoside 3-N-acetyltransferase